MSTSLEPPFILVADDDASRLSGVRAALRLAGAHVAACRSVQIALEALVFHLPNVVVVAPEMEGGKGWDLIYAARAQGQLPTVVLDRDPSGATRQTAFTAGADDVVTVPGDEREFAVRVLGLARRSRHGNVGSPLLRHRGLVMDVAAHTVRVDGRPIDLTAQQFAILRALFEANGATLARDRLLARIESLDEEPPSDRAIDLHVTRLRRRLGDDARTPSGIASRPMPLPPWTSRATPSTSSPRCPTHCSFSTAICVSASQTRPLRVSSSCRGPTSLESTAASSSNAGIATARHLPAHAASRAR